jgi:hypothetical protein
MKTVLLLLLLALSSPAANVLRVAIGGAGGVDGAGNTWAADTGVCGGSTWVNAPSTGLLPPFLNLRYAPSFSCSLSLAAGEYQVTLQMIEPNKTGAGQRIFSVTVGASAVVSNLDLFSSFGLLKPTSSSFPVTVTGPALKLQFTASVGNAVVSGISVDTVPPPPPPPAALVSSQLLDFAVAYTSASVLTINSACSNSTPCNAGPLATAYTHPSVVTLNGGAGAGYALLFLDSVTSALTVGGNVPVSCSDCLTPSGVVAFPDGAEKLWYCTATNGAWDSGGCRDLRVFLGAGRGPAAPSGFGISRYVSPVQAGPDMSFVVPGSVHLLAGPPCALLVQVYDVSDPAKWSALGIGGWSVNPATCDVTIGFAQPQSNYLVTIYGAVGTGAQLVRLEQCSGSGPGWYCGPVTVAGVNVSQMRASIRLSNGAPLLLVGAPAGWNQAPVNPAAVWSAIQ